MDRRKLITEIDYVLNACVEKERNLRKFQGKEENDVRVAFFKHLHVVLNSTVISLILTHKFVGHNDWLEEIHKDYSLSPKSYNYDNERKYFGQIVLNGSLFFVFISFEHAVRLICKYCDREFYFEQENRFSTMCKWLMNQLGLHGKDDFIDLITYIRNSLHNNGMFMPRRRVKGRILSDDELKDRNIQWRGPTFYFKANKPITNSNTNSDMWPSLVPIINEIITIFNDIMESPKMKNIRYIEDPTEPIR